MKAPEGNVPGGGGRNLAALAEREVAPAVGGRGVERIGGGSRQGVPGRERARHRKREGRVVRLREGADEERRDQKEKRARQHDRRARAHDSAMNGYVKLVGGTSVSLIVRGDIQRIMLRWEPALSLVPLARAPPKGCCPTTAPVGLSFT